MSPGGSGVSARFGELRPRHLPQPEFGIAGSEQELQCCLHHSWRGGIDDLPEQRRRDAAVHSRRTKELRMIEGIKSLDAKLQCPFPGYSKRFQQSQIEVHSSRSMEEPARRSAG